MRLQSLLICLLLCTAGAVPAQVAGPVTAPLMQVRQAERPIVLQSAAIDAEVNGGLARTTVDLVFRNPNARQLEGELQFPLRDGQQVTGFALDIDGQMRPAVPVTKAKGQQVFEAIERRRVDPALLEQTQGNQFKLRVYPIPAGGTRRVQVTYVERLPRDAIGWTLRLPVERLGDLATWPLRVRVRTDAESPTVIGAMDRTPVQLQRGGFWFDFPRGAVRPAAGLALRLPLVEQPRAYVQELEGERYFLAEVPVDLARAPRVLPKVIGLLWDSSASGRKRGLDSELAVLDRYFRAVGDAQVRLVRLRDRSEAGGTFPVRGGDWADLKRALQATVYDGATDPGGWTPEADVQEYLLVSDGLFNYGQRRFPALAAGQRLYALNSAGPESDAARLESLAQAYGGRSITWHTTAEIDRASRALIEESPRVTAIDALGASAVVTDWPYAEDGRVRIAGRLDEPQASLTLQLRAGGQTRKVVVPVTADGTRSTLVAPVWAGYSLRALGADPERNRAAIARLGQRFGVVTSETSLIVLDTLADYVQYDILPPADLRAEYARLKAEQGQELKRSQQDHLDAVAEQWQRRGEWWKKAWPKGRPAQDKDRSPRQSVAAMAMPTSAPMPPPPSPEPAPALAAAEAEDAAAAAMHRQRVEVTGSRRAEAQRTAARATPAVAAADAVADEGDAAAPSATITLQAWQPDSPYAQRLRQAAPDQAYSIYLDERDSHATSTAFYLDVADVLLKKQQPALALRVLSNLAEMDLENRHILRVLGYRLLQAEQAALAVPVFERVVRLAEEEPQSFRDLGLAYAQDRQYQRAVDSLYEVVSRRWDGRFNGVDMIALAELNAIVARQGKAVDTSRIDPRLLKNLPLDLRAVLSWDSDNSDMDLWVTDPNGERCYYQNNLTYQGGMLSNDFTGGYGPEEFALRDAKPGKYKVEANFYGDRQQLVTGATTLHLWLSTGFGTSRQRDQKVTLRLGNRSETVLVGEFEVR